MMLIQRPILSKEHKTNHAADKIRNGIHTTSKLEKLGAIKESSTELVIWERSLTPNFNSWLEQLDPSQLPNLRVLIEPADLRIMMELELDARGIAGKEMSDLLISDIERLVLKYASITKSHLVDVRLERVNHDACWRFHRDSVDKRLLTTYRGLTTEWVLPKHSEQAISQQKCFKGPIEKLGLFDVAIFKGNSAESGRGTVHRSPPIEGTGCTRLLLCLNVRTDTSPDPWSEHS